MKTNQTILKDGVKIHKYEWLISEPRAHLMIVHGYAEYAGRYNHFATYLNNRGISVTAYDQRGYGHSEGTRAYVDKFQRYVDDLNQIISEWKTDKTPAFLMGHSMGGAVCLHYLLENKTSHLAGFISTSAMLEIDKDLSPILQAIAPVLGWLFPKLPTEKLDKTYLTRSTKVLEAYLKDPLIYNKGTRARTGAEMLKAIKTGRARFKEIRLPLFVAHGDADRLTMPGGSQKLYNDASSTDKTLKMYQGMYHELINEPEQEMIMNDFANWILERDI